MRLLVVTILQQSCRDLLTDLNGMVRRKHAVVSLMQADSRSLLGTLTSLG